MDTWIAELQPGQLVLDLGSGVGSFPLSRFGCAVVLVDEDQDAFRLELAESAWPRHRLIARSDHLPIASQSCDLIICHHSLEHVVDLAPTLAEIARVLKTTGRLFVSVPNGYGLCDATYRYLFDGGGHVNRFKRRDLVGLIEGSVNVRLVRWQRLYSSFAYLRRLMVLLENKPAGLDGRLARMSARDIPRLEKAQRFLCRWTRRFDRVFRTHLAEYGWAFFFESRGDGAVVEQPGYWNVCMRCGRGTPASEIRPISRTNYACPSCSFENPFYRVGRNAL